MDGLYSRFCATFLFLQLTNPWFATTYLPPRIEFPEFFASIIIHLWAFSFSQWAKSHDHQDLKVNYLLLIPTHSESLSFLTSSSPPHHLPTKQEASNPLLLLLLLKMHLIFFQIPTLVAVILTLPTLLAATPLLAPPNHLHPRDGEANQTITINNLGVHNIAGTLTSASFFIEDGDIVCRGEGADLYKDGVIGCSNNKYWSFFIETYDLYNYKLGVYEQLGIASGIYNIVNITLDCNPYPTSLDPEDYICGIPDFIIKLTVTGPN